MVYGNLKKSTKRERRQVKFYFDEDDYVFDYEDEDNNLDRQVFIEEFFDYINKFYNEDGENYYDDWSW